MTENDEIMLERNAAHIGPTLQNARALVEKMVRVPLCAACPAAQWYKYSDDQLHCFCTQFRGVMYNHTRAAITECDGHADAIAE